MSDLRRLGRNALAKFLGEAAVRTLGALTFFLLARSMHADQLGAYTAALATASLFVIAHEGGLHLALTRSIATNPNDTRRAIREAGLVKLLAVILACLLAPLVAWLVGMNTELILVVTVAAFAVNAGSCMDFLNSSLIGLERMDVEAALRTAQRILLLILPVTAWYLTKTVTWVFAGQLAGSLLALAAGARFIQRIAPPARTKRPHAARALGSWVKEAWPVTTAFLCVALYSHATVIMLSRFRSLEETGYYGAATRLFDLGAAVPAVMATVLFPRLTRMAKGKNKNSDAHEKLLRYFTLAALPMAGLLWAWSETLVRIIYGPHLQVAAPLLRILGPALGMATVSYLLAFALVAAGRRRDYLIVAATAGAVGFLSGLMLIPDKGPEGAAEARLVSEAVMLAGCLIAYRRGVSRFRFTPLLRVLAAGLLAAAVLVLIGPSLAGGAAGLVTFMFAAWLTGALARADLSIFATLRRTS